VGVGNSQEADESSDDRLHCVDLVR
jgi:hypothetical protein